MLETCVNSFWDTNAQKIAQTLCCYWSMLMNIYVCFINFQETRFNAGFFCTSNSSEFRWVASHSSSCHKYSLSLQKLAWCHKYSRVGNFNKQGSFSNGSSVSLLDCHSFWKRCHGKIKLQIQCEE